MNPSIEFARKTALAYGAVCRPLCQELGLAQTAFDILLFLANNPTYKRRGTSSRCGTSKPISYRSTSTGSCGRAISHGRPWRATGGR